MLSFEIGVDEAGRGPLCGPVTAAAFCWLSGPAFDKYEWAEAINDSKVLKEDTRERIFDGMSKSPLLLPLPPSPPFFQSHNADDDDLVLFPGVESPDFMWAFKDGSVEEIDELNILATTMKCMRESSEALMQKIVDSHPEGDEFTFWIKIDGNRTPQGLAYDAANTLTKEKHPISNKIKKITPKAYVKGDLTEFSISSASIVAKVHRDRLMQELAAKYPLYKLEVNKGYPTPCHKAAIKDHGCTSIHRLTFEPAYSLIRDGAIKCPAGREFKEKPGKARKRPPPKKNADKGITGSSQKRRKDSTLEII